MYRYLRIPLNLLATLCLLCVVQFATAQDKTFRVTVEQSVVPGWLNMDIYIQKIAGNDFAIGESNFSVFVSNDYLNLPGARVSTNAAYRGKWNTSVMPTHYEGMSKGNGPNYVNLNINRRTTTQSASTLGGMVTAEREIVGRLEIPITDHSGFNMASWRVQPVAIMEWYLDTYIDDDTGLEVVASRFRDIKDKADFVNPAANFPLCYQPAIPVLTTPEQVCAEQSFQLVSNYEGAHAWYRDGELLAGQTGTTLETSQPGSYTAVSLFHSCRSEATQAFHATFRQAPSVSASGDTEFCKGDQLLLVSAATGNHRWFVNGTRIDDANDAFLLVNGSGAYSAATVEEGCASSVSTPIMVTVSSQPTQPQINVTDNVLTTDAPSGNLQWYRNGIIIPGANTNIFVAVQGGLYSVSNTNDCGAATSDAVLLSITGRDLIADGVGFSVYPNPFVGRTGMYLNLERASMVTLEVFNMTGQRVVVLENNLLQPGTHHYEFGSKLLPLSAGTYNVSLRVDGATHTTRIIELER